MFAAVTYLLCACASLACGVMLARAWSRSRSRLLLWSSLCFGFLSLNNLILVADKLLLPQVDLTWGRLASELLAMAVLVFGLAWDDET